MLNKNNGKILFTIIVAFIFTTFLFKKVDSPDVLKISTLKSFYTLGNKLNLIKKNGPLPVPQYAQLENQSLNVEAKDVKERTIYYKGKKLIVNTNSDDIPDYYLEFLYNLELSKERK